VLQVPKVLPARLALKPLRRPVPLEVQSQALSLVLGGQRRAWV
jgi:hypothetical protein